MHLENPENMDKITTFKRYHVHNMERVKFQIRLSIFGKIPYHKFRTLCVYHSILQPISMDYNSIWVLILPILDGTA